MLIHLGGFDHRIMLWESSGACVKMVKFPESHVNCIQVSNDKKFLAAGGNPIIHIYDVNSSVDTPSHTLEGHSSNIMALGFQRDGKWLYSGSDDNSIKIWDLTSFTCKRTYDCKAGVNTVVLHLNQAELVSGDNNGKLKIWDLEADSCVEEGKLNENLYIPLFIYMYSAEI